MKKKFKIEDLIIIFLSVFLLFTVFFVEREKVLVKDKFYNEKYEAALIMQKAINEIKREKLRRNIEIDTRYDTHNTGIIGVEFNGITTTLGDLESKRTSANPNFAAVMLDLIKETGIKRGDNLAVNFSSSFPALNIAVLSACEVLEVNPIIISSIGSSTWGGNNLDFTYIDMEEFLFQRDIISHSSKAVSKGGASDIGKDMNPDDLNKILDRVKTYGKKIIIEEDLEKNIEMRYHIYNEDIEKISTFINVGGNIVSFGNTTDSLNIMPGIIKDREFTLSDKTGLVQLFYSKEIPVIHILNIKDLAHRYGIEIDLDTPFIIGNSDVYYNYRYPLKFILLSILISVVLLIVFRKRTKVYYD